MLCELISMRVLLVIFYMFELEQTLQNLRLKIDSLVDDQQCLVDKFVQPVLENIVSSINNPIMAFKPEYLNCEPNFSEIQMNCYCRFYNTYFL